MFGLTLCLPVSSADNIGKQFGPRYGPMGLMVFLKEFFQKVNFERKSADDKKNRKNYPSCNFHGLISTSLFTLFATSESPNSAKASLYVGGGV